MNRMPICSAKDDTAICNYIIAQHIFTDTVEDEVDELVKADDRAEELFLTIRDGICLIRKRAIGE